ncbi:MAG: TrkH family potassium uptake protein, partial [Bacteroidaceae bacterium]
MINGKMIFKIMGTLLFIEAALLLLCAVVSMIYKENDLDDFVIVAAITSAVGLIFLAIGKGAEKRLSRKDGYVVVSMAWVLFSAFGMLPFYISGYVPSITN